MLRSLELRQIILRAQTSRRWASKTTNMFLPNEERYMFDGEKLTPEENEAAIPDKPNFDGIKKVHHEILRPDDVADLVNNPGWNEIFITALSKDSVYGNKNYKVVNKNGESIPESMKLYFASIAAEWVEQFSRGIYELGDLENNEQPLVYANKIINDTIEKKYDEVDKHTLYSSENLFDFFQSFRAFRNSERKLSGSQLHISESAGALTFYSISSYLLGTSEVKGNSENYEALLRFIEANIQYFSNENLKQLTGLLIDNLHGSSLSSAQEKLPTFKLFVENNVFGDYSNLALELSPSHLDKLAFLLTISKDILRAKEVISLLVKSHKIAPSSSTFSTFLSAYDQEGNSKNTILKDLSDLKPVFFHKNLSETSFKFLLHNVIDNVHDLNQLINLIEKNDKSRRLLSLHVSEILESLHIIQSSSQDSNIIKSVQVVQLIKRLVKNNKVLLDERSLEILKDMNIGNESMQFLRPYIN